MTHKRHFVQLCVCVCVNQPATFLSSDTPLPLWSRVITLAVSLADVAGTGPKDRLEGVKSIPTKWHELMWLINTALIICKLHVWLHVTWEAYASCTVPPLNKCQLFCIQIAQHVKAGQQHGAGKKARRREICVDTFVQTLYVCCHCLPVNVLCLVCCWVCCCLLNS